MRFTELKRSIPGVSQRMLTSTLRALERDGLVKRTVHPVVPPHVDYELTPLGHSLNAIVCPLLAWTITHTDEITAARATYDSRTSPTGS
jgi:DNA-binding HxlR family transcriptional regulator